MGFGKASDLGRIHITQRLRPSLSIDAARFVRNRLEDRMEMQRLSARRTEFLEFLRVLARMSRIEGGVECRFAHFPGRLIVDMAKLAQACDRFMRGAISRI